MCWESLWGKKYNMDLANLVITKNIKEFMAREFPCTLNMKGKTVHAIRVKSKFSTPGS